MIKLNTTGLDKIELVDPTGTHTTYDINDELLVTDNNYQVELLNQPRKYSFWADKLAIVNRQVSGAKQQLDLIHAKLYAKYYVELSKAKARPTKDMVEAEIIQDQEYQSAVTRVDQTTYVADKLKFIVKAFEERKDMLIQFSAEMRKDREIGA